MRKLICYCFGLLSFISLTAYANGMTLTAKEFSHQEKIPVIFTCDDKDISPALEWNNVPANTKSLTLIMSDIDAPGGTFYHWIVYNIPPATTGFIEEIDEYPAGTKLGLNSWNHAHYDGPCPPQNATHHYIFTLYALDTTLNLATNADATSVLNAMQNHIVEVTDLKVTYNH